MKFLWPIWIGALLAPLAFSFDEYNYQSLFNLADQVEANMGGSESAVIGLGGSPTGVIAALESRGHRVAHLPFSVDGNLNGYAFPLAGQGAAEFRAGVFSQLDAFFAAHPDFRTRELNFVDYTDRGRSLRTFREIFAEYKKARNISPPTKYVVWGKYDDLPPDAVKIRADPPRTRYQSATWTDGYRPYPQWRPVQVSKLPGDDLKYGYQPTSPTDFTQGPGEKYRALLMMLTDWKRSKTATGARSCLVDIPK